MRGNKEPEVCARGKERVICASVPNGKTIKQIDGREKTRVRPLYFSFLSPFFFFCFFFLYWHVLSAEPQDQQGL